MHGGRVFKKEGTPVLNALDGLQVHKSVDGAGERGRGKQEPHLG